MFKHFSLQFGFNQLFIHDWQLSRVCGQDLDMTAPPPDHFNSADSGSRCHVAVAAIFIYTITLTDTPRGVSMFSFPALLSEGTFLARKKD